MTEYSDPEGSSQPDQAHTNEQKPKAECQTCKACNYLLLSGPADWVLAVLGWLGIVAAIYTLKEVQRQSQVAEAAAHIAASEHVLATQAAQDEKDALHKTERADFQLEIINILGGNRINPANIIQFAFKNYGRTRGSDVVLEIWIGIGGNFRKVLTMDPIKPTYAAGTGFEYSLKPMGQWDLPDGQLMQIRKGDLKMGFMTKITYKDVFGNEHWLQTDMDYRIRSDTSGYLAITNSESSD